MYLWHNYGHSTIGARSDIEQVPIERLQAFYHKYYQPDNAVLVLAGKFDQARALRLIEQRFGRVPRPKRVGEMKIWPTYTRDPVQDGERSVTLRRTGDVQEVMAAYHVPAVTHPDFAAVAVLTRVLGDQPSGRLYKALVESKKAAEVGAYAFQDKEPGALIAFAQVRLEDSIGPARQALQQALSEVVSSPPTDEEVERAKTQFIKNFELLLNNSEESALEITEWAAVGDWRMLFLHRDRVKLVTPADVQRVAAAYLKPSNATYGTFVPTEKPDRAEIPTEPDATALVREYKGDTTLVAGEVFDPSPANIDHRTQRTTLPGGLKLALLPKKTRGQSVNASLTLRFGTLETLQNKGAAPDFAADMLLRGSRNLTRQQIKDSLDRLKARIGINGSVSQVNIRVETTGPNLVPTLTLLGEVLRNPTFDAKEFEELRRQNLANLEEQKSDPQTLAFTSFSRYLAPYPKGDPRYIPTIDESVADYTSASVDDAKRFYLEYYGASDGEIAVVGDFDPQQVTSLLGSIFESWKSPQPYARLETKFNDVPATSISLETPDKANAMYLAGVNLNLRDDDPDYPALMLANEILGGGFLNSRLATRVRQKDGVSYGVGSFINAGPFDHAGQFVGYAIYAPENAAKVEAGFREEIERARKDGLTADEIEKARAGMLQNRQVERSDDAALSRALSSELRTGRTMVYDATFEQQLSRLTAATVNDALRKYIDPAKLTVVKAGDFAKAAAAPAQP